jgi:carboxylesterase type B
VEIEETKLKNDFCGRQVLVVTVAYRLNIFGFFTTTDSEAPGNYGMFDQIAALDWVKRNIGHFNGTSDNIIIYGHSSGAISVGLHMLSPLSKGKFHKAIAMSGDAIGSVGSPENELPVVDMISETFGCYRRPTSALMECLRRLKSDFLIEHSSSIETWGPIVDAETNNDTDPFLPQHPRDILESGNYQSNLTNF